MRIPGLAFSLAEHSDLTSQESIRSSDQTSCADPPPRHIGQYWKVNNALATAARTSAHCGGGRVVHARYVQH